MKYLFILPIIFIFIFSGCFSEEKKVVKKRKQVNYMAEKVNNLKDNKEKLSKVVENDGIVVDGARDERLLDAFGLAVSQVMVEEGVSVPDCISVAKTGYLSEDECKEITDKYTGFYNLTEDGSAEKVDNIFTDGIKGKDVELGESEFFDSSGNPLLDNSLEFDELVVNSDDLDMLKKLKSKIPSGKNAMLETIDGKISFLEDIKEEEQKQEVEKEIIRVIEKEANANSYSANEGSSSNDSGTETEDTSNLYSNALSRLKIAISTHETTERELSRDPENEKLIEQYNAEAVEISILEGQVAQYAP